MLAPRGDLPYHGRMRWTTFAILLYLAAAMQVAHLASLGGAAAYPRIEFLPLLAIFYALYASEDAAPLTGLACGLLYDICTPATVGLYAIPLALVAWAVLRIRMSIFREHVVSQVVITLLGIMSFGLLTGLFQYVVHLVLSNTGHLAGGDLPFPQLFKALAVNAFYSALIAPGLFYVLLRLEALTGFNQKGPRNRPN